MDDIESDVQTDSDESNKDSNDEKDSDDEASKSGSDSEGEGSDDEQEDVTEDSLKEKITEGKAAIKAGRERLSEVRKEKKEAIDYLSTLKKNIGRAQKEKNAFCSLKRSEVKYSLFISKFVQSD